ncbi:hypothetical protein F5148DRAFT_1194548 [Russula earlei]|uniref:Uncharacterized protein n=1 Tax=Russula earlei TaxID=71964 RepID=A0ACC0UA94_9AGAM|nr:hypothetical protein F5148DRAFT_1194548 [Russula earlei]
MLHISGHKMFMTQPIAFSSAVLKVLLVPYLLVPVTNNLFYSISFVFAVFCLIVGVAPSLALSSNFVR